MSPIFQPLYQQVIVITGASSGIGLATAKAAAARHAKVVLIARSGVVLAEVADQINSSGGEALYVMADVGKREEVEHAAHVAVERFGRIDTWVNDAGVSIYGRLDEVSEADSRRLFDTNFWGVVNGSLAALPWLRKRGGALINVGSELSETVVPLQGMYAASKHAVKGFTDALRMEVEEIDKAPVSITLIQPTAVDTPYPEHARNYLEREARLPSPQIDPFRVAEAILHAATHADRDVKVGVMASLNVGMSKIMPSLLDRVAALQVERQQGDGPPRNPAGSLYTAGGEGHIYGSRPARRH